MFEPRKLRIRYSVTKPDGETVEFDIRLDEHGLLEDVPEQAPPWTRLKDGNCPDCPTPDRGCRAAQSIAPVVDAFNALDSLQVVTARVATANYTAEVNCEVSKVASSVMGLRMAASGCPKIAPFRAMALYHQPFSTLEETVIRAAGFMLLGHWARGTLTVEDPFRPLIDAWIKLEEVNLRVGRGLIEHCATDGAANGLVNLDMFAKAGVFGLQSALDALKPALLAWNLDVAAPEAPAP